MKEQFHDSPLVPKERLRELIQKNDQIATFRFLVMYLATIVVSVGLIYSWHRTWGEFLLALFLFGILGCSQFAALHETGHNTAFKSKKMNRIAAFLAGIAFIYPPSIFRDFHFTHHRHTHEPGLDPEITFSGKPAPSVLKFPMYFGWISGLPLLNFKLMMILVSCLGLPEVFRKKITPFLRPKQRKVIALESIFTLAFHATLISLAIICNSGFWVLFIGQIVSHCMLAQYLIMEHNGLPHEGNILNKTRSINTNKLVKFIMWNMPYHAEHHAYPAVPFHALPALHQEMYEELKHKEEGHLRFHWKTLGGMFGKQ